jgi:hypothetical protein
VNLSRVHAFLPLVNKLHLILLLPQSLPDAVHGRLGGPYGWSGACIGLVGVPLVAVGCFHGTDYLLSIFLLIGRPGIVNTGPHS